MEGCAVPCEHSVLTRHQRHIGLCGPPRRASCPVTLLMPCPVFLSSPGPARPAVPSHVPCLYCVMSAARRVPQDDDGGPDAGEYDERLAAQQEELRRLELQLTQQAYERAMAEVSRRAACVWGGGDAEGCLCRLPVRGRFFAYDIAACGKDWGNTMRGWTWFGNRQDGRCSTWPLAPQKAWKHLCQL